MHIPLRPIELTDAQGSDLLVLTLDCADRVSAGEEDLLAIFLKVGEDGK